MDKQIKKARPSQYAYLALRHYVETDRLWQQDGEAWMVFNRLPAQQQKAITTLDRRIRGHIKRRDWFTLLKQIAADQKLFEEIITMKRSGSLREAVRTVYRRYSQQRQLLLGNITSSHVKQVLHKKGIKDHQLDRPTIPRRKPVRWNTQRPMFDKNGKLINYDNRGKLIDDDTRDQMVFHWFAHALRNLSRYIHGNSPLPWQASCRARCLRERDK